MFNKTDPIFLRPRSQCKVNAASRRGNGIGNPTLNAASRRCVQIGNSSLNAASSRSVQIEIFSLNAASSRCVQTLRLHRVVGKFIAVSFIDIYSLSPSPRNLSLYFHSLVSLLANSPVTSLEFFFHPILQNSKLLLVLRGEQHYVRELIMNYDPVPICLYYGGTITQDSNGYCYDGQISHIIHANPNIRFHELERKIYSLTKWSEDTYDLGINSRWQVGRGGRLLFMLVPITDDESLESLIRNTQSGKIDWSIVELYIEKKSKEAGCSGTAEEVEDVETQIPDFGFPSNSTRQEEMENVEMHVNMPDERENVTIGEVGRIVMDELNTYDEARVNNNLVNLDDGDEAFPTMDDDDQEEEEVEVMRDLEGIEHFQRSAPEYFHEIDLARCDIRGSIYVESQNRGEFYVGQEFEDRNHLREAVKQWSINHHREFITYKSTPSVYTLKCKQADKCPWRLHASLSKKTGTFKVKTFVGPHICVNSHLSRDHRQLGSQFISKYILGVIKRQLGTTPAAIVEIINEKFGYHISYGKAWRAKNKALRYLFGGWKEAYSMLPRLLAAIKVTNPGTVSKEWSDANNLDGTRILRGFFWAFGPAIEAFRHCKPLLSIDGTFLYGKYKGVLLVAMSVDANGQLLPLAYALVEKESIDSWNWFMRCIRELVTQRQGICVISDRHAGIMNVFNDPNSNWRPPMAYHRFCMRHFAQNLFSHVKDKGVMYDLKELCSQNQLCKYQKKRKEIEANRPRVQTFLRNAPLPKWSLTHDVGGRRFGVMTTNISEVYNNVLKGARGLPVCAIVELTFYRTNEYFTRRRVAANAQAAAGEVWVEEINQHLTLKIEKSNRHFIREFDDSRGLYQIITPTRHTGNTRKGGRTHTVNLSEKECTCQKPQLLHYPCSHVLAACAHRAIDYNRFISPYYSVDALARTWSSLFQPIPDTDYWPEYDGPTYVPDESLKHTKKGRRKTRRIRNDMDAMEKSDQTRCGNCRQQGHNVRKCPLRNQG